MNIQKDRVHSNSTNSSPKPVSKRLGDLKHRLSIQIKKMIDADKEEREENDK